MVFVYGTQQILNVVYYHHVDKFQIKKIVVFMNMHVHGLKLVHVFLHHVQHLQQYNNVNFIIHQ
jgi:hypothetical protein